MNTPHRSTGRCFDPAGIVWVVCFLLSLSSFAAADPTTQPTTISDQELTACVAQLDSRAPTDRATAAGELMLLTHDDLPRLKAIAVKAQPLSPAQIQVLHDVITHVYLTGEPYNKGPTGFLGMRMAQLNPFGVDPRVVGQGIVVQSRMAGFGSYRSLLDGDVILGVDEQPNVLLTDTSTLAMLIRDSKPGSMLHLLLIRQGHQMSVPVRIDARPTDFQINNLNPNSIDDFNNARLAKAETYWQKEFGPIAGEAISRVD